MAEIPNYTELADFVTNLELELNSTTHCGVAYGALLSRFFKLLFNKQINTDYQNKNLYANKVFRFFINVIRITKILYKGLTNKKNIQDILKDAANIKARYVVGKIDTTIVRSDKLFRNLLDQLGPHILYTDNAAVINKEISIPVLQSRWLFCSFGHLPFLLIQSFSHSSFLYKKIKKRKLVDISFTDILFYTLYYTLQLNAWDFFFKKNKPDLVIVDMDRFNPGLILSAKKAGIKSVTLIHGIIEKRQGYYPVLADYVFCWGEEQRKFFMEKGIAKDRLRITGNSIAEKVSTLFKQDVLAKYALEHAGDKAIIGLAMSAENVEFKFEIISRTLKALPDNCFLLVKLHPSDSKKELYEEVYKDIPHIVFTKQMTFQEYISLVRCCVVHNSGIGYELIVSGVPILLFDFDNALKYSSFSPFFNSFFYKDEVQLGEAIKRILYLKEYYLAVLYEQQKIVKENIFYLVGQEAADKNYNELSQIQG